MLNIFTSILHTLRKTFCLNLIAKCIIFDFLVQAMSDFDSLLAAANYAFSHRGLSKVRI